MESQDDILTDIPEKSSNPVDYLGLAFNMIGFFFGGFVFTLPTLPFWMATFTGIIYIIMLLGFWGLVIDFLKDITILGTHI